LVDRLLAVTMTQLCNSTLTHSVGYGRRFAPRSGRLRLPIPRPGINQSFPNGRKGGSFSYSTTSQFLNLPPTPGRRRGIAPPQHPRYRRYHIVSYGSFRWHTPRLPAESRTARLDRRCAACVSYTCGAPDSGPRDARPQAPAAAHACRDRRPPPLPVAPGPSAFLGAPIRVRDPR